MMATRTTIKPIIPEERVSLPPSFDMLIRATKASLFLLFPSSLPPSLPQPQQRRGRLRRGPFLSSLREQWRRMEESFLSLLTSWKRRCYTQQISDITAYLAIFHCRQRLELCGKDWCGYQILNFQRSCFTYNKLLAAGYWLFCYYIRVFHCVLSLCLSLILSLSLSLSLSLFLTSTHPLTSLVRGPTCADPSIMFSSLPISLSLVFP